MTTIWQCLDFASIGQIVNICIRSTILRNEILSVSLKDYAFKMRIVKFGENQNNFTNIYNKG